MSYAEQTVHYKTYLKTAAVEGLRHAFGEHPDKLLASTKAGLEFAEDPSFYPCIIVKFYEKETQNAGIGHTEIIDGWPAKHALYWGTMEWQINTLSSLDRDLLSDAFQQIIHMGDLNTYSNRFFSRIYADTTRYPLAKYHFVNIDTDKLPGFGETTIPAPWQPEDALIYQNSYRSSIFGEFYSPIPTETPPGLIENVRIYPYIEDLESVPTGSTDPADADVPWI